MGVPGVMSLNTCFCHGSAATGTSRSFRGMLQEQAVPFEVCRLRSNGPNNHKHRLDSENCWGDPDDCDDGPSYHILAIQKYYHQRELEYTFFRTDYLYITNS